MHPELQLHTYHQVLCTATEFLNPGQIAITIDDSAVGAYQVYSGELA